MIEYVDKHATAEHIDMYAKLLTMGDYHSGMMKAKEILLNQESEDIAPTAPKIIRGTDIVQVCRCKDCKHYIRHDKRCGYWNHGVKPTMWCSQAERLLIGERNGRYERRGEWTEIKQSNI